jgi:hypothetical protein
MRRMRSGGTRVRAAAGAAAVVVALSAPAEAITFGPERQVAGPYAWNPGKSLAASASRLLAIWATDCPPPRHVCATDSGPRMGVFVQRSPAGANPPSWSSPVRTSPGTVQAERPSIAAEGTVVIASWVTQKRYLHYRASDPRVLWVRVSNSEGKRWRSPVRITSGAGRVDYPRVAVANGRLFITWTNADTGAIRLSYSDNLGASWTSVRVGTTTARPMGTKEGYAGLPDVGASGNNVAVAWISTPGGEQMAVTSSTGGADLDSAGPIQLTPTSPNDGQHYPGVGGSPDPADPRVSIAYSAPGQLEVRTFDGATLGPAIVSFRWKRLITGTRYNGGYGPAAIPTPSGGVALAVAACRPNPNVRNDCRPLAKGAKIDVLYRSSPDSVSWGRATRLTDASAKPIRIYDEPSIALTGTLQRVMYDRYERTFSRYDVAMRSGN